MYKVTLSNQSTGVTNYLVIEYITSQNLNAPQASGGIAATDGFVVAPIPQITYQDSTGNTTTVPETPFNVEYEITITPSGNDGQDGQNGAGLNGAIGVSFCMNLKATPTIWDTSTSDPPPQASDIITGNCQIPSNAPYITYTGETSLGTTQATRVFPNLAKDWEFINLEGHSDHIAPFPNPGTFPRDLHNQSITFHNPPGGPYNIPELGPTTGRQNYHNNFYGFRIPRDGKLLGFQINHVQSPMHGQFYALVYKRISSTSEELSFTYPIVSSIGNGQTSSPVINSNFYAAGNTTFEEDRYIDVKKDSYLFIAQDLSYRSPNGSNQANWNNYWPSNGGGGSIEEKVGDNPFIGALGEFHATAYLRYD